MGSIIYAPMLPTANGTDGDDYFIQFPYLREVYGYVLLGYSSHRTFGSIFPRLSIIHGRELYHSYALIIMENLQLEDVGLTSLMTIRRGNVIIARNAQLCYGNSIRWNDIVETKKTQVILRQNRDDCMFCPTCSSACWSATACQKFCPLSCKGNCLSETVCCPEECVGGCDYSNLTSNGRLICNACKHMRIYATGQCVDQCPPEMLKVTYIFSNKFQILKQYFLVFFRFMIYFASKELNVNRFTLRLVIFSKKQISVFHHVLPVSRVTALIVFVVCQRLKMIIATVLVVNNIFDLSASSAR